jgi:hypothetical protein
MRILLSITLFCSLSFSVAQINAASHLILKNDFNGDGIADRVVFASHGTSGFFQSTNSNKKIDTIFLKQGNRTILFSSLKENGTPFVKLSEDLGYYSVTTLMKYSEKKFQYVVSYATIGKTNFSDDPFADPIDKTKESQICTSSDPFENKTIKQTLTWAEAVKTYSVEEAVKKSIDPSCKNIFEKDYPKLEKEVLSACSIGEGRPEKNDLVSCLDRHEKTRRIGGSYKTSLAEKIFDDGFKITCAKSTSSIPVASYDESSKNISFYKTSTDASLRNFKKDFFHEMMHSAGIAQDKEVENIVSACFDKKRIVAMTPMMFTSDLELNKEVAASKNGVVVNIPNNVKEIPQAQVASAVSESTKTLDQNFSMENPTQFKALSSASKATFKSFDPIMKAAYEAAVPVAFAQNTIASAKATTSIALPTTKSAAIAAASSRGIASAPSVSGATYDVSSLPESVPASAKGDLGNGMAVKASEVAFDASAARAPANTEVAASGTSGGGTIGGSVGPSIAGSLASIKTTDRPDLRANVPQLKTEEDFLKTLTTGKYDEVKAKLVDPKNQRILEEKKIQYVAKDKTLGSKQPVIILKDLGNKFTVLRVNVE